MLGYDEAPEEIKKTTCNGCGAGGWKYDIIPDTLYGLDITEICNIHDWMYCHGLTLEDKKIADDLFYLNLRHAIKKGVWFLRYLRYMLAFEYYQAVSHFGERAFLVGKNGSKRVVFTDLDILHHNVNGAVLRKLTSKLNAEKV